MDAYRVLGNVHLMCNFLVSQTAPYEHNQLLLAWGSVAGPGHQRRG
jgi:hypothetical protein